MFQSLKNIFTNNENIIQKKDNSEIDILSGLMIEAANTDGKITQEELNQIFFLQNMHDLAVNNL